MMYDPSSRVSDDDRQQAVKALGEHYAVGRLDMSEFEERSEQAMNSTTFSDLDDLFTDLPLPHYETGLAVPEQETSLSSNNQAKGLQSGSSAFMETFFRYEWVLWTIASLWIPIAFVLFSAAYQVAFTPFWIMVVFSAVCHSLDKKDEQDKDEKTDS